MDCLAFLQWVLPRRDPRWAGFRKVRRQVCKRLKRRMAALDLGEYLVIGTHEYLPSISGLVMLDHAPQIFQRTAAERESIAGSQRPR